MQEIVEIRIDSVQGTNKNEIKSNTSTSLPQENLGLNLIETFLLRKSEILYIIHFKSDTVLCSPCRYITLFWCAEHHHIFTIFSFFFLGGTPRHPPPHIPSSQYPGVNQLSTSRGSDAATIALNSERSCCQQRAHAHMSAENHSTLTR